MFGCTAGDRAVGRVCRARIIQEHRVQSCVKLLTLVSFRLNLVLIGGCGFLCMQRL